MHTTFMQFWERNQHLRYGDAKAAFRQYGEAQRIAFLATLRSPWSAL